jgi:hypothetical protein
MSYINQIIHDNEFVAKKVGFFADYFYFAANTIGQNDFVAIENPLSLIDKIVIQLSQNLHHSPKYIRSYLSSVWFAEHPDFFKSSTLNSQLMQMRMDYLRLTSEKQQRKWLIQNLTVFSSVLTVIQKELSTTMFDEALKNVVSYTKCPHDIDHHKNDYIWGINCMVTEFILSGHSKKDISNLFDKLLSKDDDLFPFPTDIRTPEKRAEFLKSRTFDQQFEGIKNELTKPVLDYTFVFRGYNITVPHDFEFTYNRVTFISPNHPKVIGLKSTKFSQRAVEDFFEPKFGILACIKAEYRSLDIAKSDAIEILNQEVEFVNHRLEANCHVDPFTALLTLDFSSTEGYTGAFKSSGIKLKAIDKDKLEDNPYVILAPYLPVSKDHFLRCEPLYIKALTTKNPTAFWHYFETLLTPSDYPADKNFPLVQTVSDILLGNAEYHFKKKVVRPYIMNAFSNSTPDFLGVTKELWTTVFMRELEEKEVAKLRENVRHPFMNHLLNADHDPFTNDQLMACKRHYEHVLWETKSERNFDTHTGKRNDKASLLVEHTLPRFGTRLRWQIFRSIKENDGKPFHEIIKILAEEGAKLLLPS